MAFPSVGARVLYNEGLGTTPYWTPAWVVMTNGSWNSTLATTAGNYPTQPAVGQVLLVYYSTTSGVLHPVQTSAYATEGPGIGQFMVTP